MKFNFLKDSPKEILDFEKEIGVELIIGKETFIKDAPKFTVNFDSLWLREDGLLNGKCGYGLTINKAIKDYCKIISNRQIKDPLSKDYINCPTLIHTRHVEMPETESKRPPLGVKPKFLHEEERLKELDAAIERHTPGCVSQDWLIERETLRKIIADRNKTNNPFPNANKDLAKQFTDDFYRKEPFACDPDPLFRKGFEFGITQWLNSTDKQP